MRFGKNLAAAMIALACGMGAAWADIVPANGVLEFDVLRDGSSIGSHVYRFDQQGGALTVDIRTDIAVKLPLVDIALYRFEHQGREIWQDGKLVALTSKTNDDGKPHHLSVAARDDGLMVDGDAGAHASDPAIIPASLWNPAITAQAHILNTLDGRDMDVTVTDLGEEVVETGHGKVMARHYSVRGDLERDIWYDAHQVLTQVRFKASDGSDVRYALK